VSSVRLAFGGVALASLTALAVSVLPASATPLPSTAANVKTPTVNPATSTTTNPADAVKHAFTQALIADRQLGVPSSQEQLRLRPVPAGRTDLQAAGRQDVPSVADRQRRLERDRKNIGAHYASAALLARENHALESTMTALADPNTRILGAGVSQVTFTTVTVSGTTATIVAQAQEWTSSVIRQQADGNWLDMSPAADTIYNAKLSIGPSGTWLVTDMIGHFAHGSGP
jgi:hypothetical protein